MKGNTMSITTSFIIPLALSLVCFWIAFATVAGKVIPLISGPRSALIALLVVGMAACAGGIGQVGVSGRWTSPLSILGIILGIVILVIILSAFTGWKLPMIQNEMQSVIAVAVLIAVKLVIGTVGYFFRLL